MLVEINNVDNSTTICDQTLIKVSKRGNKYFQLKVLNGSLSDDIVNILDTVDSDNNGGELHHLEDNYYKVITYAHT